VLWQIKQPATSCGQDWLEPVENGLQKAVQKNIRRRRRAGRKVKDFSTACAGRPLHAVLTDVPIGAWTAAVVMDAAETITGNENSRPARMRRSYRPVVPSRRQ